MKSNDKYSVIVADPAWQYRAGRNTHTHTDPHYATMGLDEMMSMPVAEYADSGCLLFMWATGPFLGHAVEMVSAWGFKYVSVAFTWVKTTKAGNPAMGVGYYTRSNAEYVLLGKRGKVEPQDRAVHSIVMTRRTKHSQKPEEVQDRIERLVGPGRSMLELFARRQRPGWTCSGLELNGCDYRSGVLI